MDSKDKGKIPKEVIVNAKGLAIFSAFRAGMYFAGTAGTGIVMARLTDGSWSPPSAFSVKAGSVGIVYGVDVYDCICVLNTQEAVDAYKKSETQLGGGMTLAAGPVGGNANTQDIKPVWTYTKSRGLYGGVTLDSTSIKELPDTNADFYGAQVSATQILDGEVGQRDASDKWPTGARALTGLLKELQSDG